MNKQAGFTLIELMVSIGIGLFLIAGVFSVYINSSQTQKLVEDEVKLIDDARFALETISFDLKHAGIFGTLNHESYDKVDTASRAAFDIVPGQCDNSTPGWVTRVNRPVFAVDDSITNPYLGADCMPDALATSDMLEMRYVTRIDNAASLISNMLYVNSDANNAQYFIGSVPPTIVSEQALNYQAVAKAYYIRNFTNTTGDGIPALHMLSLQPGPVVVDTQLLEGVENMQLRFGLTATNRDSSVVTWEVPNANLDWSRVIAAKIWLVLRSKNKVKGVVASTTFEVDGNIVSTINADGYRRAMVTSVVRLRNMNTGGR
jgi:type IV pilus assembly protein PilW